ncbi:hypothetical protein BIFGAL_03668 [Bifidobacterium gallicum DSM 20093 = LMG 11596]|uniref:Uncharacterized protein n=1 Tax=Bifidobacterium gallicum DSM 20093 = LMG 11596 TaxID=561180 RepID=D1NUZ1_9BIFI|nr:hypothetical protein BIFGAL_03668 [Bifidobacterium gallicum DSM 20093 = LMG 11596]
MGASPPPPGFLKVTNGDEQCHLLTCLPAHLPSTMMAMPGRRVSLKAVHV